MKVLADKYLYKLDDFLPENVQLITFDPSDGIPLDVKDFDSLLIRTVTRINANTLPETGNLKFIGTATAGFDHVDREYLQDTGIHFSHAAGCNANAVGLYVATIMLKWAELRSVKLCELKAGIVGCGHTGNSVKVHLESLGMKVAEYDPPKQFREKGFSSVSLEALLDCDIITFHTPLTHGKEFEYPTKYMCSHDWLKYPFKLIVNAARGGVVDEAALLSAKKMGKTEDYVLDVWEHEPLFSDDLAQNAFIASPHIAGYSKESKKRASEMVVNQMLDFYQLKTTTKSTFIGDPIEFKSSNDEIGTFSQSAKKLAFYHKNDQIESVLNRLWKDSNIEYYDRKLREFCGKRDIVKSKGFAKLRSETELRSEKI